MNQPHTRRHLPEPASANAESIALLHPRATKSRKGAEPTTSEKTEFEQK